MSVGLIPQGRKFTGRLTLEKKVSLDKLSSVQCRSCICANISFVIFNIQLDFTATVTHDLHNNSLLAERLLLHVLARQIDHNHMLDIYC